MNGEMMNAFDKVLWKMYEEHTLIYETKSFKNLKLQVNVYEVLESLFHQDYLNRYETIKPMQTYINAPITTVSYTIKADIVAKIDDLNEKDRINPYSYFQRKKEKEDALRMNQLKYDVTKAKWIIKTYWFTFALSIISVIIAAILAYIKIAKD